MKGSLAYTSRKYLVYGYITAAVLLFITGLGFMTVVYPLFYNGTSEMYEFYKNVQALNKASFNGAVIIVILGFLMIGFDLNKRTTGIFATIYAVGVTVYTVMTSLVMFRAVPYYRNIYTAFDFSVVEDYTSSTLAFDATLYGFGLITVIAVLLSIVSVICLVQKLRSNKAAV